MTRVVLPCALALAVVVWACLPNTTIDGLEFACDADAGDDCQPGFRCWRGVCTQDAGWGLGSQCAADEDCANRICSAGVCCLRRCDGACERCDLGAPGQCDPLAAGSAGNPSCAPLFCDGTNTACPGGCFTASDCTPGNYCDAGNCTPLLNLGTACGGGGQCDSGICTDGVCCNSACGNPCDACNVAGRLGTCSVSPLGRVPSVSCGRYACNGTSVLCPTFCTSDAGCLAGWSCSMLQECQPKVAVLVDSFNGTGLDAGTWTTYLDPGTHIAVNNRVEFTVDPTAASRYCGLFSLNTYDATNSRISAQLILTGDQTLPTYETYFEYVSVNNQNRFGFDVNGNQLHTQEQLNGTYSEPSPPVTYNPAVHKFLRIRLDGGAALLETSADAGSFTIIGSTTVKPWMQTVYVELGAGAWAFEDGGSFSAWDNVRP
ncbi:MAG TPA: hypothetical protein VIG99_16860 [Myxococcaceae bacterium]